MPVNLRLKQKRFKALAALLVFVVSSLGISAPVIAAEGDVSIQVNNISSQFDSTTSKRIVTVFGEVLNSGSNTIENLKIDLNVGAKLTSRENLHNFLLNKSNPKFKETNYSAKLTKVQGKTKYSWQLTFIAQDIYSEPNGVYEIELAAKTNEVIARDLAVLPIVSPTSSTLVTAVMGIQISTLNSHLASGGLSTGDAAELDRLLSLIENNLDLPVSWIVDPSVRQWAIELQQTDLADKAALLLAGLDAINQNVTPSIYSQPDLARMISSNRNDDLTNLVVRTNQISGSDKIVIAPSDGRTTNSAIARLADLGVRPILSNKFVSGKEFKFVNLNSSLDQNPVLVTDSGLLSCLTDDNLKGFDQQNCLLGDLATAINQTPTDVLLTTPLNWNPGVGQLRNLVSQLTNESWLSIVPLNQFLNTPPSTSFKLPTDFEVDPFSTELIQAGEEISASSARTSSLFLDASYSDAFFLARLRGFSALWPTGDLATEFLTNNEALLTSYQDAISIDASRNITVSNTSAQIPITIVNSSDRDVSVSVALVSTQVSRFASDPSLVVVVPSGKRVTVPMNITLTGKGIVNVNANLFAPNGLSIGKPKLIQISSAEYQGFARTLVIVAFGLLVLLSISNIVRRKRG